MNESTRPPPGGGRGRAVPSRDPREIVTPYAFRVEPSLLGKPLASPWRRAAAMLVDLIVVGLLVLLKEISFTFFALLVAWVLFRLSRRGRRVRTAASRAFLRIGAIVFLVVAVGLLLVRTLQFGSTIGKGPAAIDGTPPEAIDMDWSDMARGAGAFMTLRRAETPEEARASASRLARRLEASGLPPADVRDVLEDAMAPVEDSAWADEVLEAAMAGLDTAGAVPDDVAVAAPDTPGAEGDTAPPAGATGETPPDPGAETASPEVLRLRGEVEELRSRLADTEEELADTEEELEEAREDRNEARRELREAREAEDGISLVAFGRSLQRDLGLGMGWLGLYFTVVTAFSGGRTVGKRLLGIRVVRLNGQAIGVWHAFGRFGGYAASIVTGLLGFLEIFWDANRQCLQDKLAATVVIVDRGEPPYRHAERSQRPAEPGQGPAEPGEQPAHRRPAGGDRPEGRPGGSGA